MMISVARRRLSVIRDSWRTMIANTNDYQLNMSSLLPVNQTTTSFTDDPNIAKKNVDERYLTMSRTKKKTFVAGKVV